MDQPNESRRNFLKAAGIGTAALGFSSFFHMKCAPKDRSPNILIFMADDWNWPHSQDVNDPNIHTPTFDRICREGLRFRNAFVASPSCTPSRASFLTGKHPWELETGVHLWGALPAEFQVFTELLEQSGYFVGYRGKGWGPGHLDECGRQYNPAGRIKAKEFEEFYASRPDGRPFCFWFNHSNPHRPYTWRSGLERGMKLQDTVVPPIWPDTPEVRTDICDYYYEVEGFDAAAGHVLQFLEERGELDKTIVVMTGDNGMPFPRAKITLYDLGTKVPLAIRWPEKIKPGRTVDDLVELPSLAATFLEAAGMKPPVAMHHRSLMDILTSDKSGQTDAGQNRVFSSMELHCGRYPIRAIRTPEYLFIRNYETGRPINLCRDYWEGESGYSPTWISVKNLPKNNEMYQRIDGPRPYEELYAVKKDPYQLINLAGNLKYNEIRNQLAAELEAEQERTNDPRFLGNFEEVFYAAHAENKKKRLQKK